MKSEQDAAYRLLPYSRVYRGNMRRSRALLLLYQIQRLLYFVAAVFSPKGIFSREGRVLIRGKIRRGFLSFFPARAQTLKQAYGLQGGCNSCGVSCSLLFVCPQLDRQTSKCTIYEDRPVACRVFPVTPQDLIERDLFSAETRCGYSFSRQIPFPNKFEEKRIA